jgi:hypothetical protein
MLTIRTLILLVSPLANDLRAKKTDLPTFVINAGGFLFITRACCKACGNLKAAFLIAVVSS